MNDYQFWTTSRRPPLTVLRVIGSLSVAPIVIPIAAVLFGGLVLALIFCAFLNWPKTED